VESEIKTRVTPFSEPHISTESAQDCLVVIYAPSSNQLGKRFSLGEGKVRIGRGMENDVVLNSDSVSRRHARIELRGGGYRVVDMASTNGTYVNDELVDEVVLRDGDQLKVGRTIFKFIVSGNMEAQYHEEIYRLMTVDGLTEMHNKRYFNEAIEREASRSARYGRAFSLVLFDIDHFKKINDTYGHLAGDSVLRQLGALVRNRVRRDDIPCRTGGEEFSIIVPEVSLAGGLNLAEKLRGAIEAAVFKFEGTQIPVTVSMGVAEWTTELTDPQDLVKQADERLYEAKRSGRNRICG